MGLLSVLECETKSGMECVCVFRYANASGLIYRVKHIYFDITLCPYAQTT